MRLMSARVPHYERYDIEGLRGMLRRFMCKKQVVSLIWVDGVKENAGRRCQQLDPS
jgi:hypothetical protein